MLIDNTWAEYEIIGTIMTGGNKYLQEVYEKLRPYHFTVNELRVAYEAMLNLDEQSKQITSATLLDVVPFTPEIKVKLARAAKAVVSPSAISNNADALIKRWKLAEAKRIAGCFGQDDFDDIDKYIAMYADMMNAVASSGEEENIKSWKSVLDDGKKRMFSPVGNNRIYTGFSQCDKILNGTDPTDFMLIAARPAVGKSAFKEQIIRYNAKQGKRILNISLEMPDFQLVERQTAAVGKINLTDIRNRVAAKGPEYDTEKEQIDLAIEQMESWNIDVWDNPSITPSKLRRIMRTRKYDIVFIDYAGLMEADGKHYNREQAVSSVSRAIRVACMDTRTPVVGLLQLNRNVEYRSNKRVVLADLRESGAWENDAVQVVGLSPYGDEDSGKILFEVLKNRSGECGMQILQFDGAHMTFYELEERYTEPKQKRGMDI